MSGFIASVVKGGLDYSCVIQLGFDIVCGVFAAMNCGLLNVTLAKPCQDVQSLAWLTVSVVIVCMSRF